jgi:FixJ family two-component response regulator
MKTIEPPVCVVDDDAAVREAVERLVRSEGMASGIKKMGLRGESEALR